MMAENIDRVERQPEEERNEEDFIKTTKRRSRAARISRKPTASSTVLAQTVASRTTPRSGPPPTRATLRFATSRVSQRSPWAPSPRHRDRLAQAREYTVAKKELSAFWGLAQSSFQIIAAVGLWLSGVLGLVGCSKPLTCKVLGGLGLGSVVVAITGQDNKKGGGKK
ncbi:hypothetical protein PG995_005457 [Apiospora arundinis]